MTDDQGVRFRRGAWPFRGLAAAFLFPVMLGSVSPAVAVTVAPAPTEVTFARVDMSFSGSDTYDESLNRVVATGAVKGRGYYGSLIFSFTGSPGEMADQRVESFGRLLTPERTPPGSKSGVIDGGSVRASYDVESRILTGSARISTCVSYAWEQYEEGECGFNWLNSGQDISIGFGGSASSFDREIMYDRYYSLRQTVRFYGDFATAHDAAPMAPVPLPPAGALLLTGLAGVAALRRRGAAA